MNWKLRQIWGKFVRKTNFIIHGHILNPLWHTRDQRRKKRTDVTVSTVMTYLQLYKPSIVKYSPEQQKESDEPERVFTIWLQGEENAPEIVKACFRSMRHHLKLELVVLDEETIFDWITLPEHVVEKWNKGLITRAHFSDICRVELLYEHGGIWADATDFFTAPIPSYVMDEDFFLFMAGDDIKMGCSYAYIQSCFIRGKKGNPLLAMWREFLFLYWKNENTLLDYFTMHLLFLFLVKNNEMAAELFSKMPKIDHDPTHVLFFGYKDAPYSSKLFNEMTRDAFFQKTTYRDSSTKNPRPGSVLEYMINS